MTITAIITSALLMVPRGGDPSAQPSEYTKSGNSAVCSIPDMFFGGENVTGVTYAVWARWIRGWHTVTERDYFPVVTFCVSYESARATREGGAELADLLGGAYSGENHVPLSPSCTWSASSVLPSSYLYPPNLDKWRYGCYCVNYISDTDFTVTVGGEERFCPASPTNAIFNIMAVSADRSVSISAENEGATIKFGIAVNPLVQFVCSQSDNLGRDGVLSEDIGGISSDEWRLFVVRSRIDCGNIITRCDAWRATSRCTGTDTDVSPMWHPTDHYALNSRIFGKISYAAGGMVYGENEHQIRIYAPKGKQCWMSDEEIEVWRDMDIAEMSQRGMLDTP